LICVCAFQPFVEDGTSIHSRHANFQEIMIELTILEDLCGFELPVDAELLEQMLEEGLTEMVVFYGFV
jgi:hypothetical protein